MAPPVVVGRPARCRLLLHAEGRAAERPLVLEPDENGVVQNDFFCIGRTAKNPALAHRFVNFMLDEAVAYANFVNFVGYTPPQKNIDAELLIKRGLIPKSLTRAVVRPTSSRSTRSCSS